MRWRASRSRTARRRRRRAGRIRGRREACYTSGMAPQDLVNKLSDEPFKPFKPFRVRLTNNSTIDVLDAGSVVVGPTSAIMPLEYVQDGKPRLVSRWKTVALS